MGISTIIAGVAAATAVVGTAVSAVGAANAGAAQKQAEDYNAQVARVDAVNAENAANAQAQQIEQANKRKLGEAAAAYGAGGVDMEGSPLTVMSDLAAQGELSKRLTLYRGSSQAQSFQQQSVLDAATGNAAATAGLTKAGGTLLTGLSSVGDKLQPFFSKPAAAAAGTSVFDGPIIPD